LKNTQRQQYGYSESDLLSVLRGLVKVKEGEEGENKTRRDEIEDVVARPSL